MPNRRSILCLAVVAALGLAACSGDDEASPTTVPATAPTVPPTAAPTTAVPAEPVFGSVGGFLAAYTAVGTSQGTEFTVTEDALTTGPIESDLGATGFISVDAIPSGVLGGAVDADGGVTSIFVFVDPLTAAAAPAVLGLLGSTIATPAQFDQATFAQEYRALAIEANVRAGDQLWYPSTNSSGHSLVVSVVKGATGGNNLIEVMILPIADEATALAAAKPLRNAVFALVA